MNINSRSVFALVLVTLLLPLSGAASVSDEIEKAETIRSMHQALGEANTRYKSSYGIRTLRRQSEAIISEAENTMESIEDEKRVLREDIASLRNAINNVKERYGIDLSNSDEIDALLSDERESLSEFVRYLYLQRVSRFGGQLDANNLILRRTLTASLGDRIEQDLRLSVLSEARAKLFSFIVNVQVLPETLAQIEERHQELVDKYQEAHGKQVQAQQKIKLSDSQLSTIKQTVAGVHYQILRLQSELSRIDARLRDEAEQALIDKGLRAPRSDDETSSSVTFSWPAYGPISAGYMQPSYKKYFGVNHFGMDIVVPQGSAVHSAEEGIIFLARDGGPRGYSYVLVGHRDGYATIYGHLSHIAIQAGQHVAKGGYLGLSGGQPGTYGAGLMTTGPHLHFETMRNGVHFNPRSMLQ
jgi:murein DD-endopeptidase MepM/ murein hydrolase activator NlpD